MEEPTVFKMRNPVLAEKVLESSVLVILGMHRSGTTLSSSWLQQCGLQIGDRLSYPWEKNPQGLYEDKDFVELHKEILGKNRQTHLLKSPIEIRVNGDFRQRAVELVQNRQQYPAWGWKDPRTVLFLHFWDSLLPNARYFVVYRQYIEVVDSFYRRSKTIKPALRGYFDRDEVYQEKRTASERSLFPKSDSLLGALSDKYLGSGYFRRRIQDLQGSYFNLLKTRLYLQNWVIYNQFILDFIKANPDRCLCLSINELLKHSDRVVHYLNHEWGFQLTSVSIQTIYKPEKLKQLHPAWQAQICRMLQPQAEEVYRGLESALSESLAKISV